MCPHLYVYMGEREEEKNTGLLLSCFVFCVPALHVLTCCVLGVCDISALQNTIAGRENAATATVELRDGAAFSFSLFSPLFCVFPFLRFHLILFMLRSQIHDTDREHARAPHLELDTDTRICMTPDESLALRYLSFPFSSSPIFMYMLYRVLPHAACSARLAPSR